METNYKENLQYRAAKKKVKDIKGFYVHLLVYLFINTAIVLVSAYHDGEWNGLGNIWNYSTAFFWGIGLFAHWASVFGPNILLGKDWEERKIRELMQKDKNKTWE